jgi:hypothetical protein
VRARSGGHTALRMPRPEPPVSSKPRASAVRELSDGAALVCQVSNSPETWRCPGRFRYRFMTMFSKLSWCFAGTSWLLLSGCVLEHRAPIRSAELPPLPSTALHSSRLWVEVSDEVGENACVAPGGARLLCFERQRSELEKALGRALWTSFPGVEFGNPPRASTDYVLHVALKLEALPPDGSGPGWSAGVRGRWRLERAGQTLAGEQVASRSRGDFAYGSPLGIGAGEVIDAVAVRIGMTLGALPETRVVQPVPLPAVATGPLPEPLAQSPASNSGTSRHAF